MTTADHTLRAQRLAVAAEIRALMGRHRTTQTALGHYLGMSQPTISKRLAGEVPFDMDELLAVAAFFDVQVTDLFVGVVQGKSPLPWMTMGPDEDCDLHVMPCPGQLDLLAVA